MHKYELDQFRLSTSMILPGHILYKCDLGELKPKTCKQKATDSAKDLHMDKRSTEN